MTTHDNKKKPVFSRRVLLGRNLGRPRSFACDATLRRDRARFRGFKYQQITSGQRSRLSELWQTMVGRCDRPQLPAHAWDVAKGRPIHGIDNAVERLRYRNKPRASRRFNVTQSGGDRNVDALHITSRNRTRERRVSVEKSRDEPHDKCLKFGCAFREKSKGRVRESNLSSR